MPSSAARASSRSTSSTRVSPARCSTKLDSAEDPSVLVVKRSGDVGGRAGSDSSIARRSPRRPRPHCSERGRQGGRARALRPGTRARTGARSPSCVRSTTATPAWSRRRSTRRAPRTRRSRAARPVQLLNAARGDAFVHRGGRGADGTSAATSRRSSSSPDRRRARRATRASSSIEVSPAATLASPSSQSERIPVASAARSISSRLAFVDGERLELLGHRQQLEDADPALVAGLVAARAADLAVEGHPVATRPRRPARCAPRAAPRPTACTSRSSACRACARAAGRARRRRRRR